MRLNKRLQRAAAHALPQKHSQPLLSLFSTAVSKPSRLSVPRATHLARGTPSPTATAGTSLSWGSVPGHPFEGKREGQEPRKPGAPWDGSCANPALCKPGAAWDGSRANPGPPVLGPPSHPALTPRSLAVPGDPQPGGDQLQLGPRHQRQPGHRPLPQRDGGAGAALQGHDLVSGTAGPWPAHPRAAFVPSPALPRSPAGTGRG